MNTRTSIALLVMITALLGCSTPQPAEPRPLSASAQVLAPSSVQAMQLASPPVVVQQLPPPPDFRAEVFKGKPCQLGTTCLEMDPRPFEICLLGTNKRCGDKAREPLLVDNPEAEPR